MKRMWKKTVSALLVLAMLAGLLSAPVEKGEAAPTNGCVVENGVLTAYNGTSTIVRVPEGVAEIGNQAFYRNEAIEIVYLPDSVKYIDTSAFYQCKNLSKVSFPDGLLRIGRHAFYGTALHEADLSGTQLEAISDNAFERCKELLNVTMPDSVKRIGNSAFQYCSNLTTASLSPNIQYIGEYAFGSCELLRFIQLPDSLRWLGESAFSGCQSLTEMSVPEGITVLTQNLFRANYDLVSLTLPNTLQIIDLGAFHMNNGIGWVSPLKELTIPPSVVSIYEGSNTFGASGLEKVTVTEGSEGERYFTGFQNGKNQEVSLDVREAEAGSEPFLPAFASKKGEDASAYGGRRSDFKIQGGCLLKYSGRESIVVVPDGVTEIGQGAFYDNQHIVRVMLPDSVTTIGSTAFSGCESLMYVTLPDRLTEIGNSAFKNCSSLMELHVPQGVTVIADNLCNGCTSLMSVNLGSRTTAIGKSVFNKVPMVTISLPDSLQSIGDKAFQYSGLREIVLPDSLASVGEYVFYSCRYLTSLSWPAGLAEIPERILEECCHLREVYLHDGLTTIGARAFNGCTMLTSLYIPRTVTSIGEKVFANNNSQHHMEKIYGQKGTEAAGLAESSGCSFYALTDGQIAEYEERAVTRMPQRKPESSGGGEKPPVTEEKEYVSITSVAELEAVRNHLDGNYRLDADLDLSGKEWQPIGVTGDRTEIFTGTFDGNGHSICGLTMNLAKKQKGVANGLFAIVNGRIKNLTLQNCSISISDKLDSDNVPAWDSKDSGFAYGTIAGAVGYGMEDDSAGIENCRVTGSISYYGDNGFLDSPSDDKNLKANELMDDEVSVGGIAGQLLNGKIMDCINESKVTYSSRKAENTLSPDPRTIGGICGYKQNGSIIRCANYGKIDYSRAVYGRYHDTFETMDQTIQAIVDSMMGRGDVNIHNYAAGICGYVWGKGNITECYNTGAVENNVYITFAEGNPLIERRGYTDAGGICARLASGTMISDCYNTAEIYSNCHVDKMISIIPDSKWEVKSPFPNRYSYAGGIVGRSSGGIVSRCFNLGGVKKSEGSGAVGGIATGDGPVSYCRYLEADGLTGCTKYEDSRSRCMPMTAEEAQEASVMMTDPETYRSFDFDATWILVPGMAYPQLLDRMESAVTDFKWKSSTLAKTNYGYGEALDASGLTAEFSLAGVEGKIAYDIPAGRIVGYHAQIPGSQKLNVELFGNSLDLTVTVGEREESPSEDVHQHAYYLEATYEATCTQAGKKIEKCYYCDGTKETTWEAKGHAYRSEQTEDGVTKYVCSICGDSYLDPDGSNNPDNPSGSNGSGNQNNPSGSNGSGNQNNPSGSNGSGNQNNPSGSNGSGNQNNPSDSNGQSNSNNSSGSNGQGNAPNAGKKTNTGAKTKKASIKKAVIKSLKALKGRKLKVSWKKEAKAAGYEIRYSLKKNFKKSKKVVVKGNKKKSVVIRKLKKKKKYYVRMRIYQKNGKKKIYGAYSKVKTIKIKK